MHEIFRVLKLAKYSKNKEKINKLKINETPKSNKKNTRSKNERESKAQTKFNNIYDIMCSIVRMWMLEWYRRLLQNYTTGQMLE